jgi:hypothetical protein
MTKDEILERWHLRDFTVREVFSMGDFFLLDAIAADRSFPPRIREAARRRLDRRLALLRKMAGTKPRADLAPSGTRLHRENERQQRVLFE